ncbi:CDP-alcohol phosphatidyltransferase family protein [Streptococcus equinus]|uniref:CDP-alcohol phosphatidyltransferase family protein n=1 Tax=Streptococcus equinus TaxID=1335 RepID=UPI000943FF31
MSSFYALYILAGITDVLDCMVARRFGYVSEFGLRLDIVADFILCLVCFIKLISVLKFEKWMLIWILVVAIIKLINLILCRRSLWLFIQSSMN